MGTHEIDWVAVANGLLSKCHITLLVGDLKHCDARFFVTLYEAILGEKVPDFIADSCTLEDDAHNVQSVIDSLALDYLQVSLSHITGENIVQGDLESVRNLLEIFDGLLEYLTEHISEASSQNEEDLGARHEEVPSDPKDVPPLLRAPPSIGSLSSDLQPPSWGADGSESTAELIRLGDTAHTFTLRGLDVETLLKRREQTLTPLSTPAQFPVSAVAGGDGNPVMNGHSPNERVNVTQLNQQHTPAVVPLRPPYQPREDCPRAVSRDIQVSLSSVGSSLSSPLKSQVHPDGGGILVESSTANGDVFQEVSPDSKRSKPSERPKEASRQVHLGQKKVAFRSGPDVTLSGDWNGERTTTCDRETTVLTEDQRLPEDVEYSLMNSQTRDPLPLSLADEPFFVQRAVNRLSELELQEMSKKLSQRLNELDQMLKKALGDQSRSDLKEDDKLSQHSDSIMEIRRKKHASQHTKISNARPRSLSSSPLPPPRQSLAAQFEDALNKDARGEMGKIRRDVQKELDLERLKARLLQKAYGDELKDLEETEKQKLARLKDALRDDEQEFKENIFKEPPKKSHPEKVYSGKQTRPLSKPKQWAPNLHKPTNRMKIKENDLLPLLLEEFPHLQISHHMLNSMWKGQLVQMQQLARSGQEDERSERQLQKNVEEALKKHDLLVTLIQREQEHNQRLKDFKDRIHLQKSAQNRMRENRQQVARAKRYYDDYHVQLRAKLMRARTREEKIFKKLFEEGLELQKQRLREMRSYAKDQREEQRKRHKDELESMENYYKDQFCMLAEAVSQEKCEIQEREKVQSKTLHKMKRELRAKMEREIQELQGMILKTDEDAFFRELEAERLKRRLQMASFQYSKSHCL